MCLYKHLDKGCVCLRVRACVHLRERACSLYAIVLLKAGLFMLHRVLDGG